MTRHILTLAALLTLTATTAFSALTWDADATGAINGGTGIWSTGTANWWNGASY